MSDSPLTLTEDDKNRLFTAIGSVVARFQQIELWQSEILAKQLALDVFNDRYVLMASMSFKQKIDLLMVLCKRNPNDFRNIDFQLVKIALNTAEEFRNSVVHSVWSVCGIEDTWIREKSNIRSKSGFTIKRDVVNITELERADQSLQTILGWQWSESAELLIAIEQLKGALNTA
jgi:hypothetical protein